MKLGRIRASLVAIVAGALLLGGLAAWLVTLGPLHPRATAALLKSSNHGGASATAIAATNATANATAAGTSAAASASAASTSVQQSSLNRLSASMAFDEANRKVVLFGGYQQSSLNQATYLDDTWTWDGSTWHQEHPATSPPGRSNAGMTYDPVHKLVLLWGGFTANGDAADFWSWDGTTWTQIRPTVFPPAQHDQGSPAPILTYDNLHHVVILIRNNGSHPAAPQTPDVWSWDGSTWTHQSSSDSPAIWGSGIDDPQLQATLVFGVDANRAPQTWTFAAGAWKQQPTSDWPTVDNDQAPPMVYDASSNTAVLVGETGDLWQWDGRDWVKQGSSGTLSGRRLYAAVSENINGTVLLFGGVPLQTNPANALSDTWVWDGQAWKRSG